MTWVLAATCAVASIPAGLRWLRIAQREHYLAPSTSRFAIRWWMFGTVNRALLAAAIAGIIGAAVDPVFGLLVVVAQLGPVGLAIKGRTSPLAWTSRMRRVAIVSGVLVVLVYAIGGLAQLPVLVALGLLLLPVLVDLALILLAPVEKSLGNQWVRKAAGRLRTSGVKVVAITGSYGKTTTKGYVAHLLSGSYRTVASPASFNNRMGLARAINENLVPGTEVFVAEMGTYGPGEIAELCEWIPPTVAAMVAVGPVHLERFRTEERIVAAKSEILDRADVGVIAVDHPLLAQLAAEREPTIELITVATPPREAKVSVDRGRVFVDGREIGDAGESVFDVNLAVAVGVALAFRVKTTEIAARLSSLPRTQHRQSVTTSGKGVTIIDDTYNSNPAGAEAALDLLAKVGGEGRRVVVTPGMVELGPRQDAENAAFASRAGHEADELVVVGGTNRRSLLEGSAGGKASVTVVDSREDAVEWVRENLGEGDAVLYENDLPDHYP